MSKNSKSPPINLLVAYPYFLKNTVDYLKTIPKANYRLLIDSGAFTVWNSNKTITLDDYCRFLDSVEHLQPFKAVQLDVFGDPKGTWKNFLEMRKRGYDVIPVFTRGDTMERLDEMYSLTDYVMFGGITVGGKNMNYVKWFMEQNGKRKIHWLGFCNLDFIKHYRPFSVDSSSWASCCRFGNLSFYKGYGQTKPFSRKVFVQGLPAEAIGYAKRSGIGPDILTTLKNKDSWVSSPKVDVDRLTVPHKGLANFLSAVFSVHSAIDLEKHLGTRYYMACCQGGSFPSIVVRAHQFLIERGII